MRRGRARPLAAVVASVFSLGAGSAGATITGGPVVTAGPTVIGTAAAGKLLTGLSGTWAGFGGITYRFQWYRCNAAGGRCVSIHGATSPSYELVDRDVGKTIGLTVSGTDSTGTSAAYSSLVGPIATDRPLLESTAQPIVSGPPIVDNTVQVTTGTWSPEPTKIVYIWERCNANGRICAAIPNATGSSYAIGRPDLGHALLAVVQATYGTSIQNAFSTMTPAIVDGSVKGPTLITGPTVAGIAVENQQLLAATGIWKGVGTVAFTFQWYRCDTTGSHCTAIHGATQAAYSPGARDVDRTMAVTERAADATGTTVAYATLVGPVAGADAQLVPTTLPTITGVATAGGKLTVGDGLWSSAPSGYAHAWLRCNRNGRLCTPIPGASSASYLVTRADTGHRLIAEVTASSGTAHQSALTVATTVIS